MSGLTGLTWMTSVKTGLLRLARGTGVLLICLYCPHQPLASETVNHADCLHCHEGIESINDNHRFPCAHCHLPPGERQANILTDHEKIVRNPSGPQQAEAFCGPCHKTEIEKVRTSLHSTMAGVINQTRFLWGAQDRPGPALYGLSGGLMPLPEPGPEIYPQSTAVLVDDFLRRRCLRCHIHTKGPAGPGIYRATGCAACHVLYDDDGLYKGKDAAIDRSKPGYPALHTFTAAIPNAQCLHCHNHNHVGADYEGLFEHDYHDAFRSPLMDGKPPAIRYGLDHHRLVRDVHGEKGLWCIDCHTRDHVMGDGHVYSFQMEVPKRPCTDCHGGFDEKGPDKTHPSIRKGADGLIFLSKNHGRQHRLPLFRPEGTGHQVEAHARVRCSACHAQWSFQDYGMSVMREDRIHDYKWLNLTMQGDPWLQEQLKACAKSPDTAYPMSTDYLSGRKREGIWSVGWRFRRWELMPLGMDQADKYAILRPLYQYLVTYVDRGGNVVLDSAVPERGDGSGRGWAFMPYVPHTTAPFGRACVSCHMNPASAGQGIQDELTCDTALTVPSPPAIPGLRLLKPQEAGRLLLPPRRWHRERLKALR
ncbi:MAG: hypothetical protein B5M55_05755 [Desulfococcus sp. 4484_242]|nr:MAG: hypothetical protein B5M55_05755 [Desulfococcus sp. 4484_242]